MPEIHMKDSRGNEVTVKCEKESAKDCADIARDHLERISNRDATDRAAERREAAERRGG